MKKRIYGWVKGMAVVTPCFLVFNENLEAWWWNVVGLVWLVGVSVGSRAGAWARSRDESGVPGH